MTKQFTQFKNKITIGALTLILTGLTTVGSYANGVNLTDIQGHWGYNQIQSFVEKGFVTGYPDHSFRPETGITRAEFVRIFNKVCGLTNKSGKVFNDTQNHWAKDEIDIAVTNGVCQGIGNNLFGADDNITREEAAKMVANYKKIKCTNHLIVDALADAGEVSDWAKDALEAILYEKYMFGYIDEHKFKPQNNITRAEAVSTLTRLYNKNNGIKDDKEVKPTIKEEGKANTAPNINIGNSFINKGEFFDINTLNLQVSDNEDGIIPNDRVKIVGLVDTNTPGKYPIQLRVKDSKGCETVKAITVTVIGKNQPKPVEPVVPNKPVEPVIKPVVKDTAPTLTVQDCYLRASGEDIADGLELIPFDFRAKATDKEDGDISKQVKVDETTYNPHKSGIYNVRLYVTDSTGNTVEAWAKANISNRDADRGALVRKVNSREFKDQVAQELLKLVNEHRASKGVGALAYSKGVEDVAEKWSKHMYEGDFFDHEDSDGKMSDDLFDTIEHNYSGGENIAMATVNEFSEPKDVAKDLFERWKASGGHDKTMLRKGFTHMGLGYTAFEDTTYHSVRLYVTQEFGYK